MKRIIYIIIFYLIGMGISVSLPDNWVFFAGWMTGLITGLISIFLPCKKPEPENAKSE